MYIMGLNVWRVFCFFFVIEFFKIFYFGLISIFISLCLINLMLFDCDIYEYVID